MKTPEEIKYALRWCYAKDGRNECFGCPYRHEDCDDALYADAFSYIQQLEDHIRDLTNMVPRWISAKERLPEKNDNAPAVDAEPVRHGKWKSMGDCGVTECSACEWNTEEYVGDYKYCPCCGAKMDADEHTQIES